MNNNEYEDELIYQDILNNYYITNQIYENYCCDELNKNYISIKHKIYLLENLQKHRNNINIFRSRNTTY